MHLWQFDLVEASKAADRYEHWLSADERRRGERYRASQARRAFVLTRGRLRELLGDYLDIDPASVALASNDHGKPLLQGSEENSGLVFSVSHSGDRALLAFARDTALGADAELLRPRRDLEGLARHCLSEPEWSAWQPYAVEQRPLVFLRYWVCKEAFVKATGRGIALGMNQVGVSPDFSRFERVPVAFEPAHDWHLAEWGDERFRFAVAYSGLQRSIVDCP